MGAVDEQKEEIPGERKYPQTLGQPCKDGSRPRIFTNTAVPRFDGTGCWEQHLLVFQAIAESNGWSSDTAALQLFAHLDGEALQVVLLMLNRNKECWKDIADELSAYYNTRKIHLGVISQAPRGDSRLSPTCTSSTHIRPRLRNNRK